MKFMRTSLALPFLAALWWGSCYDLERGESKLLPQHERDGRLALCGFAASCIALIVARQCGAFKDAAPPG